jgi:hypothetical protein
LIGRAKRDREIIAVSLELIDLEIELLNLLEDFCLFFEGQRLAH